MKNKFLLILVIVLIFSVSGCQKYFDINHDPDALEDAPIEMILPAALSAPLDVLGGGGQIIGGFWAQHWTQATGGPQYQGYDSWQVTSSTFDGRGYGALYYNGLKDLEYIKNKAAEDENWNYYLIATATQCYVFQMLVDLYDEIPFSGALKGDTGNPDDFTPVFEKGEDIYDSLIVRIDNALAKDFSVSSNSMEPTADIIFAGDIDKWKAFANTLKLKIYLRKSAKDDVDAEILALQDKTFLMEDASYDIFMGQAGKRNPMYDLLEISQKGNVTISATLMSLLVEDFRTSDDPKTDKRIDYIAFKPAKVPEYHRALFQGNYNNIEYATDIQYLSRPRFEYNDDLYYFTEAECYFLLAEADVRYWHSGNEETFYEQGVTSAFKRFNYLDDKIYVDTLETENIDAIINGYAEFPEDNTDNKQLEMIWQQKWISMANIQGMEAFIEHNRTNYPAHYLVNPQDEDNFSYFGSHAGEFTVAANNVTGDRFPRRLLCPQSEVDGNSNVSAELKAKKVYDPVWWDID